MDWAGKRVLVVGGGVSGLAAAKQLTLQKAQVFLTDKQPAERISGWESLSLPQAQLILGREPDMEAVKPDLVVLSPGVSPHLPFLQKALTMGVPLWSEVEFALRDSPAYLIGITGSNGKTTTTTLAGELVKKTGRETVVAGNIGIPLSAVTNNLCEDSYVVAELSSFQLEWIDRLRVRIAVLLNITPDHLDRHGTLERYAEAKGRILVNQTVDDLAVLNWDDPLVRVFAPATKARIVWFSSTQPLAEGLYLRDGRIFCRRGGLEEEIIAVSQLQLRGRHNAENVMAVVAIALELGLSREVWRRILTEFAPVAHRQEVVGVYDGILYINDSKGTNPDSAIKALYAYDEPIVLLAGGRNKGLDMTEFLQAAKERAKFVIFLGEAAEEMVKTAQSIGLTAVQRAKDFSEAVHLAITAAKPGDVVLLSPACTSWDMFRNYEERGELFKDLVRNHYSESI